jgi:two-component system, NtrC family, response regulator AtoC
VSALDRTKTTADDAAPPGAFELVVVGPGFHHRLVLQAGTITVGRGEANSIRLEHTSISRHHLTLFVGRELFVEDVGSRNGSLLNGRRLQHVVRHPLSVRDVLEVGPFKLFLQPAETTRTPLMNADDVVLRSPAIRRAWALAEQVARGEISVLVLGETGVGKDVLAHALHAGSRRSAGPFVRLNCAALSEALLESELFGHVRGAFTGSAGPREGLVESAHGGTLFLDEVGELTPTLQAKLLHVIETREVTRVGSSEPKKVDVRFVAATHRRLAGNPAFRTDLYFRLAGAVIEVPPLRERSEDLFPLAEVLLARWAQHEGRSAPTLSPAARARLAGHAWPGNIRELRNVLERAALTSGQVIDHLDLDAAPPREAPIASTGPEAIFQLSATELAERDRIIEALEACAGNQTRAAKALGWARSTLAAKLVVYRIPRPRV